MAQFIVPDFIKNKNVDSIHKQMRDNLPKDIDVSEGSHPWNLTYPTAYEYAFFAQFCLLNAIKLIWPEFSYGVYSDYHGDSRGMSRRKAQYAVGYITVTGKSGTIIPKNSTFSTEQIANNASIKFLTTEEATISEEETAVIPIIAVLAGKSSNVIAGTVVINSDKIQGITSVTNEEDISGGYDEEDDDSFNERMKEYDQTLDNSFIGNNNDYRRWAMSVTGVGEATVISPDDNPDVEDDSGIITIIITDSNGKPGSKDLCAAVYNYIMQPTPLSTTGIKTPNEKTGIGRLAPPGVTLVVNPPETIIISVSAMVELNNGANIETITELYLKALQNYLLQAINDGEIRYTKVCSVLSSVEGVKDYKSVKLNNAMVNIQLNDKETPIIDNSNISIIAGEVD